MPDPTSHAHDMITTTRITIRTIRPSAMPRFWWLNPWATAKYRHSAATALKAYADRADAAVDFQRAVIEDQSAEIRRLRARVEDLHDTFVVGKPSYDINPKDIIR